MSFFPLYTEQIDNFIGNRLSFRTRQIFRRLGKILKAPSGASFCEIRVKSLFNFIYLLDAVLEDLQY